jgi:3-dehydroquinate dehydratase
VGGAIGIVDSIEKNRRMDRIELRIDALEKSKDVAEHKPYVPSYHNMNLMTQHNTDLLGINYKGK